MPFAGLWYVLFYLHYKGVKYIAAASSQLMQNTYILLPLKKNGEEVSAERRYTPGLRKKNRKEAGAK